MMPAVTRAAQTARTYVRHLADRDKKRVRNSFVPVALQQGFRVLYELENGMICKHSFFSVSLPQNRTKTGHQVRTDMHDNHTVIW